MAILEWAFQYALWAVGGYAVAVGIFAGFVARDYVRTERKRIADESAANLARQSFPFGVSYAGADCDGDGNGATGRRRVSEAERRSVWGDPRGGGVGRHDADRNPLRADAEALT